MGAVSLMVAGFAVLWWLTRHPTEEELVRVRARTTGPLSHRDWLNHAEAAVRRRACWEAERAAWERSLASHLAALSERNGWALAGSPHQRLLHFARPHGERP